MKSFLSILFILAFVVVITLALKKQKTIDTHDEATPVETAVPAKPTTTEVEVKIPVPANPVSSAAENISAQKKVKLLKEILASKNDNDPRLDSEFRNLSESSKALMRQEYNSMAPEKFNQKGTVVFLLGRNLKTRDDFNFLGSVLNEPLCQNIADCSKPAEKVDGDSLHEVSADSITLVYPQIVSLKALEPFIVTPPADQGLRDIIVKNFQIAAASKNATLSKMGRNYLARFLSVGGNP